MKKPAILSLIVLSVAMITAFTISVNQEEETKKDPGIRWLSYAEASKLNAKHPKKIFIDVYTGWCGWCVKMDKTTFKDPKITEYINDNYYAVKLDAESNAEVTYKGKTMTEMDLAKNIFRASAFPTTVYLDQDQNLLQPISGYLTAEILDKILHFYGEDQYKVMSWEQFQKNYNSSQY